MYGVDDVDDHVAVKEFLAIRHAVHVRARDDRTPESFHDHVAFLEESYSLGRHSVQGGGRQPCHQVQRRLVRHNPVTRAVEDVQWPLRPRARL